MSEVTDAAPYGAWHGPDPGKAVHTAFWDRQAEQYGERDMTDNEGELAIVTSLTNEFIDRGWKAEDVVTFGGADGSRDPGVVLTALNERGQPPGRIYFNDLSARMTEAALEKSLGLYAKAGSHVTTHPGPAHEVAQLIPRRPRRVIIGMYSAKAFIHGEWGLDCYLLNRQILGSRFYIQACSVSGTGYNPMGVALTVNAGLAPLWLPRLKEIMSICSAYENFGAFQVIGEQNDVPNGFLSHWYGSRGARALIDAGFAGRTVSVRVYECPKGMVFCIDPPETPQGIVTILNNVVGNIRPSEQVASLQAVSRISE